MHAPSPPCAHCGPDSNLGEVVHPRKWRSNATTSGRLTIITLCPPTHLSLAIPRTVIRSVCHPLCPSREPRRRASRAPSASSPLSHTSSHVRLSEHRASINGMGAPPPTLHPREGHPLPSLPSGGEGRLGDGDNGGEGSRRHQGTNNTTDSQRGKKVWMMF